MTIDFRRNAFFRIVACPIIENFQGFAGLSAQVCNKPAKIFWKKLEIQIARDSFNFIATAIDMEFEEFAMEHFTNFNKLSM